MVFWRRPGGLNQLLTQEGILPPAPHIGPVVGLLQKTVLSFATIRLLPRPLLVRQPTTAVRPRPPALSRTIRPTDEEGISLAVEVFINKRLLLGAADRRKVSSQRGTLFLCIEEVQLLALGEKFEERTASRESNPSV